MTADPTRGYVPHIDGLRAIAVLAVIVFHLDPAWLPGGFTGVDVFFVISGFVVSASVHRLPALPLGASMLRFYSRRLRRIVPALLACLLLTALASVMLIPESWLSEASDRTGQMAFIGFSNWVLAGGGTDYFAPRAEFNPYTHTWSLGVEEQFYLLFPLLFLAWTRAGRLRGLSVGLFALATAASLAYAVFAATQPDQAVRAFYATTTRFWQLGAGVLLFQLLHLRGTDGPGAAAGPGRAAPAWSLLAVASLALLGWNLWSARAGHSPWPDGLWAVLASAGLLLALHQHPRALPARLLGAAPLRSIGLISYSLYLWHWPVFVLMRWTLGLDTAPRQAVAVLLVFALAWASWRWVERPFRGPLGPRLSPGRWVAVGVAALLLGAGVQTLMYRQAEHLSLSTVSRHPADWYPDGESVAADYPDCELQIGKQRYEAGNVRTFARGQCARAAVAGTPANVFVVGDSHAMAYNEMLRRLALENGTTVWQYGRGGCSQLGLQDWRWLAPDCPGYAAAVRADIARRAKPGDVVLMVSLRVPRLSDQFVLFDAQTQWDSEHSEQASAGRAADVAQGVAQWRPLAESGVRLILEAPKPVLPAPPYRCSDRFNAENAVCRNGLQVERQWMQGYRAPVLAALQQAADGLPGAVIWDPLPVLCESQWCRAQRDGRPLFFDGDHLSGYGNRLLLSSLQKVLAVPATAPQQTHSGS